MHLMHYKLLYQMQSSILHFVS
ncbi:hypothetical protein HYPGJ_30316 [Hyphomicrobium sp. GJ21]|nr:hypothetical protein HYPGJ_30316 [Hyphomicrobium sp. GJ21]